MKSAANELPEANQFFTGIKFCKLCEFRLISQKFVPAEIISKLPIREVREI